MVDNLKSAVLKRIVGKEPTFNPKYLDFANHYGFTIAPCAVGKGNEKGRVESGVGYVKKNFLAGLDIPDFNILNPAVIHWLNTVANIRLHGETGQRPVDRLPRERESMTPLPPSTRSGLPDSSGCRSMATATVCRLNMPVLRSH
jgi:hypothetical protein